MLYFASFVRIHKRMEDDSSKIVKLLKKGSAEGFRLASETFGPRIFALVLEITGSRADAEELTSDVLMKVFRNIHSFRGERAPLSAWILAIAHHSAISAVRRRQNRPTDSLSDRLPEACVDPPDVGTDDRTALVEEAINALAAADRTIIHLRYYENYSLKEISEITGISAAALAVRLMRLREKIKRYILNNNGK